MARKRRTKTGRTIPMTPRARDVIEYQYAAFIEKFGREPGPGDPIFFDPSADKPKQLDPDFTQRAIVEAMAQAGVAPQIIFAYTRTGMIVSDSNAHLWSPEDLAEWNAAIDEYFALEDKAEGSPN